MSIPNQCFVGSSYREAMKGLWPQPYDLKAGCILYRFIDTGRRSPEEAADGPWWFEYEHYSTIKHFAGRHGYPLSYAARLFAAILYEWSEVNAVVRAELLCPLQVWKGKGKQVEATGKDLRDIGSPQLGLTDKYPSEKRKMTPMQSALEVYQLYIPGLGHPHWQFKSYFKFLESIPI